MAYSDDCLLFFVYFGPCSYIIVWSGGKKYADLYARRISPTPPVLHSVRLCSPAPLNTPGISNFGRISLQGTALEGKA